MSPIVAGTLEGTLCPPSYTNALLLFEAGRFGIRGPELRVRISTDGRVSCHSRALILSSDARLPANVNNARYPVGQLPGRWKNGNLRVHA